MHFMIRPDAIIVWKSREVNERLSWYRDVMLNHKPAKYLICKHIPIEIDLREDEEELWREHDVKAEEFRELHDKIIGETIKLDRISKPKKSFLDLKIELTRRMITHCNLCERKCNVNRMKGEIGFCRLNSKAYVSSWFQHWGEEAPLVPSGTIFFSSCNFRCVFCQNYDISQLNPHGGMEVDERKLAKIERALREGGARNINYVGGEPTPNLHVIVGSLKFLDVNVPLLWNSNMYCSLETLKILLEIIDIALPDFKYGNNECGRRLSKVEKYFEIVSRNHRIMYNYGIDMIIRHLVMPNHIECCTKPILKWIAKNTAKVLVNIMGQYRPEYLVYRRPQDYPDINRRPRRKEMEEAFRYADKLGICYRPVS